MNVNDAVRIWRRRPALTAALILLGAASFFAALAGLPGSYQSQASVVLLASQSAARLNGGNPYLSFTPSLTLTADAVSRELMSPAIVHRLAARGFTGTYAVTLPPYATATTGSVLLVSATGSDKTSVQAMMRAVTAEIGFALNQIEGRVRPADRIRVATLSFSPQPTLDLAKTARPVVVLTLAELSLVFGIPLMVDGWLTRRRVRQRAELPAVSPDHGGLAAS